MEQSRKLGAVSKASVLQQWVNHTFLLHGAHAVWHPADAEVAAPVDSMTAAMAELEEQLAHSLLLANNNAHAATAPPRKPQSHQVVSPPRHMTISVGALSRGACVNRLAVCTLRPTPSPCCLRSRPENHIRRFGGTYGTRDEGIRYAYMPHAVLRIP
jgi:hypothetical protein